MIHLVFDRPNMRLKIFVDGIASQDRIIEASGAAWGNVPGNGGEPPYGHNCCIQPGHYKLTQVERFNPPIPSEGVGQVYVADLIPRDISELAIRNKAQWVNGNVSIGGIELPIGGLTRHVRGGVMLHSGGSNLGEPACFEPMQPLLRTFGCTRLHNQDQTMLMDLLEPQIANGQHVIFSCVGDPAPVNG